MSGERSLSDQAVDTLAAVRAIGEGMDLFRPERHKVRDLKRSAEAILRAAFDQAAALAYTAAELSQLVDSVREEEAKKHAALIVQPAKGAV